MSGFSDMMKTSLQEVIDNWENVKVPKASIEPKSEMKQPMRQEAQPKPRTALQDRIKNSASSMVGNRISTIEKNLHDGMREKLRKKV